MGKRTVYDYQKVIEGVNISATYISGLQQVLTTLLSFTGNKDVIAEQYKRISAVVNGDKSVQMTAEETNLYVLISLIQELKKLAKEQGISKEVEISKDLLGDVAKMSEELLSLDRDNAEAVGDFNAKYEKLLEQVSDETVDVRFDTEDKSS